MASKFEEKFKDDHQADQRWPLALDYRDHPGFQVAFQGEQSVFHDDCAIEERIQALDRSMAILAKSYYSSRELDIRFDRDVRAGIHQLSEVIQDRLPDAGTCQWVAAAFEGVAVQLRDECAFYNRQHLYVQPLCTTPDAQKHLAKMHADGFVMVESDQQLMAQVLIHCQKHYSELKKRALATPAIRFQKSLPLSGPAFWAIQRLLTKHQILAVAQDYRRSDLDLNYCALEYSHPGQSWYQHCYSDISLPTAETAYMHCDYETTMVKAVIYLNSVDESNGPFSFIRGSHLWGRSRFLHAILGDLDHQHVAVLGPFQGETYYRPRFKYPAERRRLLSLPKILQGSSHVGDDLLDGSKLSNQMLQREVKLTGNTHPLVLFDGAKGVHRGGLVQSGERWALQLGFSVRPERSGIQKVIRNVRGMVGNVRRGYFPF